MALAAESTAAAAAGAADNEPPPGFTALFNGRDLTGWFGWGTRDPRQLAAMSAEERADYQRRSVEGGLLDGNGADTGEHLQAHWRVENGELINDGQGLYATTEKDFGDFELLVDWLMQPQGDSGVYLRGYPQVQIWDFTEEAKFRHGADKGSGGLWNNRWEEGKFPSVLMDRPFGEWNTFRIRMIGERVTVVFNDTVVVDDARLDNYFAAKTPEGPVLEPVAARGPIQLQTHGSEIRWKNVFIREIPPEEADRELAARDADGFVELVNGRDLSNWQGAVDSYEIRDGAIVCREGKGGDLLSAEEYGDCTIRLEFRLPPGGNNGVALRVPPGGSSSTDGLEIQIIDDDGYNARAAEEGRPPLEPWQHHGSLYGCVGAAPGSLRPAGTWNFQEIDIEGQRIRVTLNGTRILDVDIDALDRAGLPKPTPGLDLRQGRIGLAGHHDPVEVRSFRVRRR